MAEIGGRRLFDDSLTYDELEKRFENGEGIRRTNLGEEFSGENARDVIGDAGHILFIVKSDRLLVEADGGPPVANRATKGDTVLWIRKNNEGGQAHA